MDKQKREKIILMSIAVIVVVGFISAFSLAALKKRVDGNSGKVVYKAGDLEVILDESGASNIELENAIPTTDEDGSKLTPYNFSIKNNGDADICYELYLADDTQAQEDCTSSNGSECELLQDSQIKYQLVQGETTTTQLLSTGRKLSSGTLKAGESSSYQLRVWLDYDADNSAMGKYFFGKVEVEAAQCIAPQPAAEALLAGVGPNGAINTSDPDQTFITGTDPNNYIWYSGKLWRAVSIDPADNSVKLVTQWNISSIPYNASGNTAFEGSYMETWLNDTSVDGFLGNLREPEKFIKTDSVWNATMTEETTKPAETTMVEDTVGLLNIYEYTMSYSGTTYSKGYLNNGLYWWTLTPYSTSDVRRVNNDGYAYRNSPSTTYGTRPAINLKSSVKVVSGDGSENNPYRLEGDNDSNLNGTLLNTRYSGEYIKFGEGENTLYRIVSHETSGLTKITSAEPLKSGGTFVTSAFGNNANYSSNNTIGTFLNGDYLTSYVGDSYSNMIEPSTTWYLGTVGDGTSYKLAKYADINMSSTTSSTTEARVGLLRLGELMSGQFDRYDNNTTYWTLTRYSTFGVRYVIRSGNANYTDPSDTSGTRPSMNLKSSVVITGGSGTKSDPFVLAVGS